MPHGLSLNPPVVPAEDRPVPLTSNESRVLEAVAEKGSITAAECAEATGLGPGISEAVLRSLVNKGLAVANTTRRGLTKKPDGTYSLTRDGRAALVS
jgi:DNA-binding MarR family transcriptional regulator